MTTEKKPAWEVRIHGSQHANIDADLLAQTVVILSRELAAEVKSDKNSEKQQEGTHGG